MWLNRHNLRFLLAVTFIFSNQSCAGFFTDGCFSWLGYCGDQNLKLDFNPEDAGYVVLARYCRPAHALRCRDLSEDSSTSQEHEDSNIREKYEDQSINERSRRTDNDGSSSGNNNTITPSTPNTSPPTNGKSTPLQPLPTESKNNGTTKTNHPPTMTEPTRNLPAKKSPNAPPMPPLDEDPEKSRATSKSGKPYLQDQPLPLELIELIRRSARKIDGVSLPSTKCSAEDLQPSGYQLKLKCKPAKLYSTLALGADQIHFMSTRKSPCVAMLSKLTAPSQSSKLEMQFQSLDVKRNEVVTSSDHNEYEVHSPGASVHVSSSDVLMESKPKYIPTQALNSEILKASNGSTPAQKDNIHTEISLQLTSEQVDRDQHSSTSLPDSIEPLSTQDNQIKNTVDINDTNAKDIVIHRTIRNETISSSRNETRSVVEDTSHATTLVPSS